MLESLQNIEAAINRIRLMLPRYFRFVSCRAKDEDKKEDMENKLWKQIEICEKSLELMKYKIKK